MDGLAEESVQYSDAHYSVVWEPGARRFRVERTMEPFGGYGQMQVSMDRVAAAVSAEDRSRRVMLLDYRDGPFRNDDTFEQAFGPFLRDMATGFFRVALLVTSAMGKLQAQRYVREHDIPLQVFVNEALARTYLAT